MSSSRPANTIQAASPHESLNGSFELNESLNISASSQEMKSPAVSRTPKVLNTGVLGQSAPSVVSVDSIESSLKRSVTFSMREEGQFEWGTGSLGRVPQPVLPPTPNSNMYKLVQDNLPEVLSDGEYSEDFDDGPTDGPLGSSASYAEDFEDSAGEHNLSRSGPHDAPDSPPARMQRSVDGSEGYSSNFDAPYTSNVNELEQAHSNDRRSSGAGCSSKFSSTDIDKLLNELSSETAPPFQISRIRHKLINVSLALGQTEDLEYRDAAARLGRQLEEQLEQLEVDLIAGERRRRAEARMRLDEKQAARARLELRRFC